MFFWNEGNNRFDVLKQKIKMYNILEYFSLFFLLFFTLYMVDLFRKKNYKEINFGL